MGNYPTCQAKDSCPNPNRQSIYPQIHKQTGRHSLPSPMLPIHTTSQICNEQQHNFDSGTSPWQGEHRSGLTIQATQSGLERLETISNSIQGDTPPNTSQSRDGPICFPLEHPTPQVHELEAGSGSQCNQRVCPQLDTYPLPLSVSSNDTNRNSANQIPPGQSTQSHFDYPQLALETMVASPTQLPNSTANTATIMCRPTQRDI